MTVRKIIYLANLFPTSDRPFYGTFVEQSSEAMKKEGWDVSVVALPFFGRGTWAYIRFYMVALKHLIGFEGVVYVHYVTHSVLPAILARSVNTKLKVILHYHGSDAFPEKSEGRLRRILKKKICAISNAIASLVVVPSQDFKDRFIHRYEVSHEKLFVSPSGGVNTEKFSVEHARLNESPDSLTFIFVGRMIEEKGCLIAANVLVEIWKNSSVKKPIKGIFRGAGPCKAKVENILSPMIEAGACSMGGAVSQEEFAKLLRRSDVFLFPSYRQGESLGLVVLEAMASGVIPVVVAQGAMPEILREYFDDLSEKKERYLDAVKKILEKSDGWIVSAKKDMVEFSREYSSEKVAYQLSNKFEVI